MDRTSSYLSERVYDENNKNGILSNNQNEVYWIKVLSEKGFENFCGGTPNATAFLQDKRYTVQTTDLSADLFKYLLQRKGEVQSIYIEVIKEKILFPEFYYGILEFYNDDLKMKLQKYKGYYGEDICGDFSIHLAGRLQDICVRTLIVQMHSYKQAGMLKGGTSGEEYEFFCAHYLSQNEFFTEIFEEYPVLYRCIVKRCEQITSDYVEVVKHFCEDRRELQKELFADICPDRITGIKGGFSDLHNGGKQVLFLQIDDTKEIVYKPHSMRNEKAFYGLLDWLGRKTGIEQYAYSFLSRNTYSWSICVEHATCTTKQQSEAYYVRLGVELFLAYLLGTKDLHYENIIASGEYPVLVDLEVLVSAAGDEERKSVTQEINYQLSQSVLYTGVLPFYHWNQEGKGIDSSAVSGIGGQEYPFKMPVIGDPKTSDMRIEYQYGSSKNKQNLATIKGKFYAPYLYKNEIAEGFGKAYIQAMRNKDELMRQLAKLENVQSRVLVADTQRYGMTLSGSYHPSLLKDGADREVFLYSMWRGRSKEETELVNSEVKNLLDGDVPYFYCTLNQKDLFCKNKVVKKNYFSKEPVKEIYDRIDMLSENELEKQLAFIHLSLDMMHGKECKYMNNTYFVSKDIPIQEDEEGVGVYDVDDLIERLLKFAVWNQEKTEVSWFTVQLSSFGKTTWRIKPMKHYLYDGLSGMLLLFYKLKQKMHNKEVSAIYNSLRKMLFRYTDEGDMNITSLDTKNTGAYEGESSIAYVYVLLFYQSGEKQYLQYAEKHMAIVEKLIDEDTSYDLLTGNAGAAWIFMLLYRITNKRQYLYLAERAVNRLTEKAESQENGLAWSVEKNTLPMAGMAHGNSGILMPIIALWKHTGKKRYKELAEQVLNYEDCLYDSNMNNWKDMRRESDAEITDNIGPIAWCHGAPGILYSRVICYGIVEDEACKRRLETDIKRAYSKLREYWKRDSYCLCHGTMGNLWILNIAEQKMKQYGILKEEEMVLKEINIKRVKLLPQEEINPGFMNGYGGIICGMCSEYQGEY